MQSIAETVALPLPSTETAPELSVSPQGCRYILKVRVLFIHGGLNAASRPQGLSFELSNWEARAGPQVKFPRGWGASRHNNKENVIVCRRHCGKTAP